MALRRLGFCSRDADVGGREHREGLSPRFLHPSSVLHASTHLPSTYPPSLPPSFPSSIHPPSMNSSRHPSSIHHLSVHPYTHPLFMRMGASSIHAFFLPPSLFLFLHPSTCPSMYPSLHVSSIYHLFVPSLPPSYIHGSIYAFIFCYPSIDPLHLTLFSGQVDMS